MNQEKDCRTQLRHILFVTLIACGALVRPQAGCAQAPAPVNKQDWHGVLALGMTLTRGNSDTFSLNGTALAEKLLPRDEFRLGAEINYGLNQFTRSNEVVSAENVHGFGDYKHLFTDRWYGDARIDAFHDAPADVKYRVNIGPAVGYYFIKSENSRLSAEAGPGFEMLKQDDHESKFFTLRISERGEHSFTKTTKVWEEVDYFPRVDDFGDYLVLSEVGAEVAINTRLALRVVGQDKYTSRPAPGRKNNDVTLITAVAWKY